MTTLDEQYENTISWADEVLRSEETPLDGLMEKLLEEVEELRVAWFVYRTSGKGVGSEPYMALAKEMADVAIVLFIFSHRTYVNLARAVLDKMTINRSRKWGPPGPDGRRRHVEGT